MLHDPRLALRHLPALMRGFADLLLLIAPKHHPHTLLIDSADRRAGVVPCQLLPYGLAGFALRSQLWRQQNRRLDARLRRATERQTALL